MIRILISASEQNVKRSITPPSSGNVPVILGITLALENVPIGNSVAQFSVSGAAGQFTYSLTNNPGGAFSISGNQLVVASQLSVGNIVISVQAVQGNIIANQSFTITVTSVVNTPPIPVTAVFQGDVVLDLATAPGGGWITYTLTTNPGNFFFIAGGNQVIVNINPPIGLTSIVVTGSDGSILNYTFNIISVATVWLPGQRPFAASSPGNQALASNAILVPVNWPPPFTSAFYYANTKFEFDRPTGSAPLVTVTPAEPGWGNPATPFTRQMTSGFNNIGGDTDHEAISIVGNNCMSLWIFNRVSDTVATTQEWAACNILTDSGFGTLSPFSGAGILGSGQSCMMGALVKEEFTAGEIQHVIAICMYFANTSPGVFSPAINSDASSNTGFVSYGQILAIPKTTPQPGGLSANGPKLFRALQNYGAIVSDTGINQFYIALNYNNSATSWTTPDVLGLQSDAIILIPLLQKTGYPLDGIAANMSPFSTAAPQLQTVSYTGNAMHVVRDSDSTGTDVAFGAAPQSLLNTSTITTFCSGTTGRVSIYYTQEGTINFTSAGANAPIIFSSGALKTMNGQPAISFDGATNWFVETGSSANYPKNSMYLAAVIQIPDYAANYGIFGGVSAGGLELRVDITTGLIRLLKNGGTTIGISTYPIPTNAPVIVSAFYNSDGSYAIWLNGINVVQGTGTLVSVTAGDIQVGAGGPAGTELFKGLMGGWLICSNINASNLFFQQQFTIEAYYKNFWGPLGTIAVNGTTLDPAHKNAGVSLFHGNLDAFNNNNGNGNVYSTVSKSTGLFYFEILCVSAQGTNEVIGIANNTLGTASFAFPGQDLNSIGYANGGSVFINNVSVATIATWTTNSTVGIAVDLTHSKVWFGVLGATSVLWNNDVIGNQNPATNTGGISISTLNAGPYFAVVSPQVFSSEITANFGGTAYKNQTLVPSGFGNLQ